MLSMCGNSFKNVGNAFQVKLVERMLSVCKAVIKAKGGYFEESQIWNIYFDLFNTFLVTTWFHMCYFIVLRSSLLFYNVEIVKIKKNPWMSRCYKTFDGSVCCICYSPIVNLFCWWHFDILTICSCFKGKSTVETITKWTPHLCFGKKLRDGPEEMYPLSD